MAGDVLPLLLSLFGLVAVGQILRLTGAAPPSASEALGRVLVLVTLPAWIVVILAEARFDAALLPALAACAVALVAVMGLTVLLMRRAGASRPAQGAAGMTAAFSNTAFLGLPFVIAIFPGSAGAATAAVLIDSAITTLLLLTLGVSFSSAMAAEQAGPRGPLGRRLLRGSLELARRPLVIAVIVGLGLAVGGIRLPQALAGPLTQIGESTPTLAFLTIGLGLDLGALRGQARPLALISALKLGVTPTLAALVLLALDVRGEAAQVAVLQSAMPTAVVAGIIAGEAGCDRGLSSAAPVVTTLLAMATLPLVVMAARAIGL